MPNLIPPDAAAEALARIEQVLISDLGSKKFDVKTTSQRVLDCVVDPLAQKQYADREAALQEALSGVMAYYNSIVAGLRTDVQRVEAERDKAYQLSHERLRQQIASRQGS